MDVIHSPQDGAACGPPGQGLKAQPSPLGLHLVQSILQRPLLQWHTHHVATYTDDCCETYMLSLQQSRLRAGSIYQPGTIGAHLHNQAQGRRQPSTCQAGYSSSTASVQHKLFTYLACVLRHLLDGCHVCREAQLQCTAEAEGCSAYMNAQHSRLELGGATILVRARMGCTPPIGVETYNRPWQAQSDADNKNTVAGQCSMLHSSIASCTHQHPP